MLSSLGTLVEVEMSIGSRRLVAGQSHLLEGVTRQRKEEVKEKEKVGEESNLEAVETGWVVVVIGLEVAARRLVLVVGVIGPGVVESGPAVEESVPVVVESGLVVEERGVVVEESGPVVESGLVVEESGLVVEENGLGVVENGLVVEESGLEVVENGLVKEVTALVVGAS